MMVNRAHDIEKGLPRNIAVDGKKSKLICNIEARISMVNKLETGLEYPREVPVSIHAEVASPLMVIPTFPMTPEVDVPEQETLDVADKAEPQFTMRATPQCEREMSIIWV
jgi:hypothetical protein